MLIPLSLSPSSLFSAGTCLSLPCCVDTFLFSFFSLVVSYLSLSLSPVPSTLCCAIIFSSLLVFLSTSLSSAVTFSHHLQYPVCVSTQTHTYTHTIDVSLVSLPLSHTLLLAHSHTLSRTNTHTHTNTHTLTHTFVYTNRPIAYGPSLFPWSSLKCSPLQWPLQPLLLSPLSWCAFCSLCTLVDGSNQPHV